MKKTNEKLKQMSYEEAVYFYHSLCVDIKYGQFEEEIEDLIGGEFFNSLSPEKQAFLKYAIKQCGVDRDLLPRGLGRLFECNMRRGGAFCHGYNQRV